MRGPLPDCRSCHHRSIPFYTRWKDHSYRVTSPHPPGGTLPHSHYSELLFKPSNIVFIYLHNGQKSSSFWGAAVTAGHVTELSKGYFPSFYSADLLTRPPFAQQKALNRSLQLARSSPWCSTAPMQDTLRDSMWHLQESVRMCPLQSSISAPGTDTTRMNATCTLSQGAQSPWSWFFPQPPIHLHPCWPLGNPVCLYKCTMVSPGLPSQTTKQNPQSVFLPPSHQQCAGFIPITSGAGLLLSLIGTGQGTAVSGTQKQIIKAHTHRPATPAEYIGLLHQTRVFLKKFFFNVYLFIFERDRDRVRAGEGPEGERETQNPKQVPGSELSAQSPMRGSNPCTVRP